MLKDWGGVSLLLLDTARHVEYRQDMKVASRQQAAGRRSFSHIATETRTVMYFNRSPFVEGDAAPVKPLDEDVIHPMLN